MDKKILGLFDKVPNIMPIEDPKGIYGRSVAIEEMLKAIIKYGSYDEYHFFVTDYSSSIDLLSQWKELNNQYEKVKVFHISDLKEQLYKNHYFAFHSTGAFVSVKNIVNIRNFISDYIFPITSVNHSLFFGGEYTVFLDTLFSGLGKNDAIICTSDSSKKTIDNIFGNIKDIFKTSYNTTIDFNINYDVIPLGVNCEFFSNVDKIEARKDLNLPAEGIIFLWIGRFSVYDKADLSVLISVFSKLVNNTDKPVYLLLAGEDRYEYTTQLVKLSNAYGVSEKVIIRKNPSLITIKMLYSAADVFVSPVDNLQESFGISIIEAMASGLPVIASDWDGYKDTVVHGVTGYKVPTYWADVDDDLSKMSQIDDWTEHNFRVAQSIAIDNDKLYEYMRCFVEDENLAHQFGAASKQRAMEIYDWSHIIKRYEDLWEKLNNKLCDTNNKIKLPTDFSYYKFFSHYSTHLLKETDKLIYKKQKTDYKILCYLYPQYRKIISNNICDSIVQLCQEPISVADIYKEMKQFDKSKIKENILWLIKHGYLYFEDKEI